MKEQAHKMIVPKNDGETKRSSFPSLPTIEESKNESTPLLPKTSTLGKPPLNAEPMKSKF
jgi:hypothetical protein